MDKPCAKCTGKDNPFEYSGLYLNNEMQIFIDAEDGLDYDKTKNA